jgi:hypothetical protein
VLFCTHVFFTVQNNPRGKQDDILKIQRENSWRQSGGHRSISLAGQLGLHTGQPFLGNFFNNVVSDEDIHVLQKRPRTKYLLQLIVIPFITY